MSSFDRRALTLGVSRGREVPLERLVLPRGLDGHLVHRTLAAFADESHARARRRLLGQIDFAPCAKSAHRPPPVRGHHDTSARVRRGGGADA